MTKLNVNRLEEKIVPDAHRVIPRFFRVGDESRYQSLIHRVLNLTQTETADLLNQVLTDFDQRHRDIVATFADHYERVKHLVPRNHLVSEHRRLLIGAYFTMEYAIESAALFNPSIVRSPHQDGIPSDSTRYIMSLRATGEGHVSSIVFRRVVIDRENHLQLEPVSDYTHRLKVVSDRHYDKHLFWFKLREMGAYNDQSEIVMQLLNDGFTLHDLNNAIEQTRQIINVADHFDETTEQMLWLARSNYQLEVPADVDPSAIVIFPSSDNEIRGIEDVRLVEFTDDDGSACYYGTYTAFNGIRILPQLIESVDFRTVRVHTLNGRYVQNKGLALFPRRIDGDYVMVARIDGENLYLCRSDNIHFWNEAKLIQNPKHPWEYVQIGNCGSPLETEAGWLMLTHGVGPMRRYCIGATLLDREDPSIVKGQLQEPLLVPEETERDGYVPNVVYTCGAVIHCNTLIMPYAVSDWATRFATVDVPELLDHLTG